MALFANKQKKIQELGQRYEKASKLGYNEAANTQVQIINDLCDIGSEEAFSKIEHIIATGSSRDYMSFAIPEILGEQIREILEEVDFVVQQPSSCLKLMRVLDVLLKATHQGQNLTIRNECTRQIRAQSKDCKKVLMEYRALLIANEEDPRINGQSLIQLITDFSKKLQVATT